MSDKAGMKLPSWHTMIGTAAAGAALIVIGVKASSYVREEAKKYVLEEVQKTTSTFSGKLADLKGQFESIQSQSQSSSQEFAAFKDGLRSIQSQDFSGRLTIIEGQLASIQSRNSTELASVKDQLESIRADVGTTNEKTSSLSALLQNFSPAKTFNTVYVFKHIFDFPNPAFNTTDEQARELACDNADPPEPDWTKGSLDIEKKLYKRELDRFDRSTTFTFFTMGDSPPHFIRHKISCYRHGSRDRDLIRSPEISLRLTWRTLEEEERESEHVRRFGDSNERDLFDHDTANEGEFWLHDIRSGISRHELTASIVPPDTDDQECPVYWMKVAKDELDRCDFEAFVFARDSLPQP